MPEVETLLTVLSYQTWEDAAARRPVSHGLVFSKCLHFCFVVIGLL